LFFEWSRYLSFHLCWKNWAFMQLMCRVKGFSSHPNFWI
jgi:hypothetical protein